MHSRIFGNNLNTLCKQSSGVLLPRRDCHVALSQYRSIFTTSQLQSSWIDRIKGVFTGEKDSEEVPEIKKTESIQKQEKPSPNSFQEVQKTMDSTTPQPQSSVINKIKGVFSGKQDSEVPGEISFKEFTLDCFADELSTARKVGAFKQYVVGRSGDATFKDSFEKQEAILRFFASIDPTGENLQSSHKQEAMKKCKCTIIEVESVLSKFTWAKQAQQKIETMQKEGKPLPKSFEEVQKLMGSTPLDTAKSNLAKSGKISRNANCPCGSKKRYKRCCGK